MKITLQGYEPREWTSEETGKPVRGTTIHYTHRSMSVTGEAAAKKFFSERTKLPELYPGKAYILEFDGDGRLVEFILADSRGAK